jgi:hypothetical protein
MKKDNNLARDHEKIIDELIERLYAIHCVYIPAPVLDQIFTDLYRRTVLDDAKYSVETEVLDILDEIGQISEELDDSERQLFLGLFHTILSNPGSYRSDNIH